MSSDVDGYGAAGEERSGKVRSDRTWNGTAWPLWLGEVRKREDGLGEFRQARRGWYWPGRARIDVAGLDMAGGARFGAPGHGLVGHDEAGKVGHREAVRGPSGWGRQGVVRRGES